MALITAELEIPDVGVLFPSTRRRKKVRPHGTAAAYRRHYRRKELPVCAKCARWHRLDMQARRKQWASTSARSGSPGAASGSGSARGSSGTTAVPEAVACPRELALSASTGR